MAICEIIFLAGRCSNEVDVMALQSTVVISRLYTFLK